MQLANGGTPLQSLTYGYTDDSDLGSITDGVDGADSAGFGYDDLHRLETASGLWGGYGYSYDALNNLKTRTGADPLVYDYDPASHRLLAVSVPSALTPPSLTLSADPTRVVAGGSTTLSWTSQSATSCDASGAWSGDKAANGSQSLTLGTSGTSTFVLTCTGAGGSASAQVMVAVANAPTLSLSANPTEVEVGDASALTWTSQNASACRASGDWSGDKALSGTEIITFETGSLGTHSFVLTCTGEGGGSVSQTATVKVTRPPPCCGTQGAEAAAPMRQYAYDDAGRIETDGQRTYTWNLADQITQIPGIASYAYDAHGKRIKVTKQDGSIEYALYDLAGQLVYTQKGTTQTDHLSLSGTPIVELANGTPTYLHPDLLGSPRLATDRNKAILWREHYEPYGKKMNGVGDKLGYTGHAYDSESQLTYMQARFYDAEVGRFLSTDPQTFTGNPFSFNRYAYANNSPYNHTDPTGMCPDGDKCVVTGSRLMGGSSSPVSTSFGAAHNAPSGSQPSVNLGGMAQTASSGLAGAAGVTATATTTAGIAAEGATAGAGGALDALAAALGRALGTIGLALSLSGDTPQYETIYRVYGGEAQLYGRSWTPTDPRTVSNYRDAAGLPNPPQNTGQYLATGALMDRRGVIVRPSLPLNGRPGMGVTEYFVPNPVGQIRVINTQEVDPSIWGR